MLGPPRLFLAACVALAASAFAEASADHPGPAAVTGRVVELPPFLVSDAGLPLHWRYAAFDQFEVLSVCDDQTTGEFMRQVVRLHHDLDLILPPDFQLRQSLPVAYLLCSDSMQQRLDRDIPAQLLAGPAPGTPAAAANPSYQVLPNIRLEDLDSSTVFALLDEDRFQAGHEGYDHDGEGIQAYRLALTPEHVQYLLDHRVPRLPAWFADGFLTLYPAMTLPAMAGHDGDHVSIGPFVWISADEARALRIHPPRVSPLLPMADLLEGPRPPAGPAAAIEHYRQAWNCQAALLIRWALDGRTAAQQLAFWRLVARAANGSVAEADCQAALGLGYAELGAQLDHYLAGGALRRLYVHEDVPPAPVIFLHDATDLEVARVKGDWERRETVYVRHAYPELSGRYLELARRTLHHAYDRGERDPRLLATMGLTECDAGDDAAALPFLLAATQAEVVRPRAYLELARIRLGRAQAGAPPAHRLDAAQVATILQPLAAGSRQFPPLFQNYALAAQVWSHSQVSPAPADLAFLEDGVRCFPHDAGLAADTAVLAAQAGQIATANALIDGGLDNAVDDDGRARLVRLRILLAKLGQPLIPPPKAE